MIFPDLSNFLTGENITFFVIYGLIVLVAVIIFFIVVRFFIKIIISAFKKIFYREEVVKDQGENFEVVVNELEESKEERRKMENQKSATTGIVTTEGLKGRSKPEKSDKQSYNEKEQKDIAEGLSKLKSDSSAGEGTLQSKMPSRIEGREDISKKGIKIPTSRKEVVGGGFIRSSVVGDKIEDKKQDTEKSYNEKEQKDIAEGLSKLKSDSSAGEGTLQSKMPSRIKEGGDDYKEIKIPTSSKLHGQTLIHKKKESDGSIFGGKSEISRTKLEDKIESDTKIWEAARQTGLTLSPTERAKLVKEVFSSALGRNISKTDLNRSIKKLNQKMLDTKNPTEHEKIRKEIKFFKKIGDIR